MTAATAWAEADCGVIDKIPFVIEESGRWCLSPAAVYWAQDELRYAILVKADNVTIDLAGYQLKGPRAPARETEGIYSNGYTNLTVTNGTIEGFMYGIRIEPALHEQAVSGSYQFKGLALADNSFRGISVFLGKQRGGVTLTDTLIARTGGTTVTPDSYAMGIEISGASNCRIEDNQVVDTMPVGVGEGVAISLSGEVQSCLVRKNYLANSERSEWGRTIGFWSTDKHQAIVFRDNFISNFTYGAFDNAVSLYVWNVFDLSDCTPENVANYYTKAYREVNQWERGDDTCSDTPQFLAEAAEKGDARAQYRMGLIATENTEAERWYRLAAEQGLQAAIDKLARLISLKKS